MTTRAAAFALALMTGAARAGGDGGAGSEAEAAADAQFRVAEQHAAAGDAHAIDELEALGATRPVTRWSDDAWAEAARLAERANDYARARRDLEQALAVGGDEQLARRLRGDLARLARTAGASGEWTAVAAAHDRLVTSLGEPGDPRPALAELERLVDEHAGYPRAADAMLAIARGWERDGEAARARTWFERAEALAAGAAAPASGGGAAVTAVHARAELVRFLIRQRELADARTRLADIHDPALAAELESALARARTRQTLRWLAWGALFGLVAAAAFYLRRATSGWRDAARAILRPPTEVLYLAPVAVVLVLVSSTGNPLVARAVRAIAVSGVVIAWVSGAILEGVRRRKGRIAFARAAAHAALAALAVVATAYLAVDRDRTIDLVVETWRTGPQMR